MSTRAVLPATRSSAADATVHLNEESLADSLANRPGYVGRIPVRNLWLLMLYASELLCNPGWKDAGLERSPENMRDLVAKLLSQAVGARLRRRLSSAYEPREAVLGHLRGCLDVFKTERRQLLAQGRLACRFAELTADSARNRFVRSALESIAKTVSDPSVARNCRSLARIMRAMGAFGKAPSYTEISREAFGRNDVIDRPMVTSAKLALDLLLPTEGAGPDPIASPSREQRQVRRLFEHAVGGFYRYVLPPEGWQVRLNLPLRWQIDEQSSGVESILPGMRTDITLDAPSVGRRIIIDTKFNALLEKGWYREQSLRSGYLYQIYAYLRSQDGRGDALSEHATGLLLHPSIGAEVDESVVIQGHRIRFATINLTGAPAEIRLRLLSVIEPPRFNAPACPAPVQPFAAGKG